MVSCQTLRRLNLRSLVRQRSRRLGGQGAEAALCLLESHVLDRAIAIARSLGIDDDVERWQQAADAVRAEVLVRGWSTEKQAFVQRYATDSLDASNLVIPFVGFLPADDPRVASTMEAISDELAAGPLVRRYNPVMVDDGLGGQTEGAFTTLSF